MGDDGKHKDDVGKYKNDIGSTKLLKQITYQGHQYTALSQKLPVGREFNGISINQNDLYGFTPKIFEVTESATIVYRVDPIKTLTPQLSDLITEKVKLLHLKGYGHGNLTLENIVLYKDKPYFIGFDKIYKIEDNTWKRELIIRKKGYESLEGLMKLDYKLWGGKAPKSLGIKDPYIKRFHGNYPVNNIKYINSLDFARIFSCTEDYYIASVEYGKYFDMTGIYRDYSAAMKGVKSFLTYHGINQAISLNEITHKPSDVKSKFKDMVLEYFERSYLSPKEYLLPIQEIKDLSFLSNGDEVISRLSARYYDSFLKVSIEDARIALKLLDLSNLLGCNILTASFALIAEDVKQVVRVILSIAKEDSLEEKGKHLIEYAIRNNPSYVATLLSHATNIDKPLPWFYEIMSRNIRQTRKILNQIRNTSWNVHYSYMIFLVESYVNIEGDRLPRFLLNMCEESLYYRIIAYYEWDKNITKDIVVNKIDSYQLQTREYPRPIGFNYPNKPFNQLIGSYPTHHYIPQKSEDTEILLDEYQEIISKYLGEIEVLAFVNNSWQDLKDMILGYLKTYDENTQKLVTLTLENFY